MVLDHQKLKELRLELDDLRLRGELNVVTFDDLLERAAKYCTAAPFFLESFINKAPGDWIQKYIVPAVAAKPEIGVPILKKAPQKKRLLTKASTSNASSEKRA